MSKATDRANELYPNGKTFCGGVSSIARDAYLKGVQESIYRAKEWIIANCDAPCNGEAVFDDFKRFMMQ